MNTNATLELVTMTDQEIKQAAIDALKRFRINTDEYEFTVERYSQYHGLVLAVVKNNNCEWLLYYEIANGALKWTEVEVTGFFEVKSSTTPQINLGVSTQEA